MYNTATASFPLFLRYGRLSDHHFTAKPAKMDLLLLWDIIPRSSEWHICPIYVPLDNLIRFWHCYVVYRAPVKPQHFRHDRRLRDFDFTTLQRLFPSNRNHVNVCHGGNAEVWLELYTGHSSAWNRLFNGAKMGHICHLELCGIMSQSRSKSIFAGFTVKWWSLQRPYLRKSGKLAVAVLYIAECQKHSF